MRISSIIVGLTIYKTGARKRIKDTTSRYFNQKSFSNYSGYRRPYSLMQLLEY